jgi:hypothetical protein
VRGVEMTDTKYLRGVNDSRGNEEGKPLITDHKQKKTPKEILEEMKRISGLISDVS